MLNIFIDGGGNRCVSVQKYLKLTNFNKVYVFEPNTLFHDNYHNSGYKLIRKAIWIENCIKKFYISKDQNQVASSLLKEKLCKVDSKRISYWHDEPLTVKCIDFSQWLKLLCNSFKNNCIITLKLDIEGAEYEVLQKMINDDTICLVNKLYVEFHSETLPEKKEIENQLIINLKKCGVTPNEWD